MNCMDFKYQQKKVKQELLFQNGVYLCHREEKDFSILLYQIDNFYVEVYFDKEEKQIGYMRAFTTLCDLDPYLPSIDMAMLQPSLN